MNNFNEFKSKLEKDNITNEDLREILKELIIYIQNNDISNVEKTYLIKFERIEPNPRNRMPLFIKGTYTSEVVATSKIEAQKTFNTNKSETETLLNIEEK